MTKKELEAKTVAELKAIAKKARVILKAVKKADIVGELVKELRAPALKPAVKALKPAVKKAGGRPALKAVKSGKTKKAKTPAKKKTVTKKQALPVTEKKIARPKAVTKPKPKLKKAAERPAPAKPAKRAEKKRAEAEKPTLKPVKEPMGLRALEAEKVIAKAEISERALPVRKKEAMPAVKQAPLFGMLPPKPLPAEYGEDMVTALTLEPTRVFVFWEIKESTLKKLGGRPSIRVYDVTEAKGPSDAKAVFDIEAKARIGSAYVDVHEEREYIVDIGLVSVRAAKAGRGFSTVARSHRVSTFRRGPAPEGPEGKEGPLLPEEHYDFIPQGGGSEPPIS